MAGVAAANPVRPEPAHAVHDPVLRTLRHMTLEEKVGQLFVTTVAGDRADTTDAAHVAANRAQYGVDNAEGLIAKYRPGGIIYFPRFGNVSNPRQIAALSNGIQRAALGQRTPVPMLVSTDQEQGIVTRVGPPATQFPGSMALGASRRTADVASAARITGQELRAVGINQNFAPVADVNVNPANPVIGVRAFGDEPGAVAAAVARQVSAYQGGAGVVATVKHFPGHGDTDVDSHVGLPVIAHTREQFERTDLPPFVAAVRREVGAVMTAHILVPALDPNGDPATLSAPVITGLLRQRLRYDGVVVTDALDMPGVRQKYGDHRVPVLALKAGVDQLLMPPQFDLAYRSVLAAVRGGELTEARIDASVCRILRLKARYGLFRQPYVDEAAVGERVGTPRNLATARAVTDRTTTLIRNDARLLPLQPGPRRVLVTGFGVTTSNLAAGLGRRGATVTVLVTGAAPTQAQIEAAAAQAKEHDLTVTTTMNTALAANVQQRLLVAELLAAGKPVVAVAVRDPYDVAHAAARTYLATYSYAPVALESLVRVLFGEVDPSGRLPVAIPVAGRPGETLYRRGHGLRYG
jgi:beta-N-acetylhexosaminidase